MIPTDQAEIEGQNDEWAMTEDSGMRHLEEWAREKYVHGRFRHTREIACEIRILLMKYRHLRRRLKNP